MRFHNKIGVLLAITAVLVCASCAHGPRDPDGDPDAPQLFKLFRELTLTRTVVDENCVARQIQSTILSDEFWMDTDFSVAARKDRADGEVIPFDSVDELLEQGEAVLLELTVGYDGYRQVYYHRLLDIESLYSMLMTE